MTEDQMFTALHRMMDSVLFTFCELHRIQFSAPWTARPGRC
jgi:hypothetical protein